MQKSKIKNQNDISRLKKVPAKSEYRNFAFCFLHFEFQKRAGFTLLEMIVSFGIFTMLVVAAIGITLGVSNAQIKTSNTQTIIDNIRFSLELISKEMRTGSEYTLSSICVPTEEIGSEISFLTSSGEPRTYFLDLNLSAGTIMRAKETITTVDCENPAKVKPFTSEDVSVDRLSFSELTGADTGPTFDGQPRVTISLKVRSKSPKYHLESTMELQTTVVQRLRDL